jgi:phosphoenolpyruvate-protein kinase (PTS system EI component)
VGAVVTEIGGWLSHAAILAREYGVPTIVGVPHAMQAIEHGEIIRLNVDGSIQRLGKVAVLPVSRPSAGADGEPKAAVVAGTEGDCC